jgi:hypothetical protein
MSLKPDLSITVRFLLALRPRGPWTLSAIQPDSNSGAPTATFIGKAEVEAMREWIADYNKRAGVYFSCNPMRARMHKRPCEADVAALQYVALDFDPKKAESISDCRERVYGLLDHFALRPTFTWSSGNGVQALWKLKPAEMLIDQKTIIECKQVNLGMIHAFAGAADKSPSLEHLYRLPGTINHPNKVKRATGRVPTLAGDFLHNPEAVYTVFDFPMAEHKVALRNRERIDVPPGGWDTIAGVNDFILYCCTTRDVAAEGRAGTAIRTARRARDYGVSEEVASDIMWCHWVPRCEYEWDQEELLGKVTRAYQNAQNDPGCRTKEYRLLQAQYDFRELLS